MRSEDEIKKKIELLKSTYFQDGITRVQQIVIVNKINELKWVIKDNSDDSWMILQEDNQ